jgi:hypothetical protein
MSPVNIYTTADKTAIEMKKKYNEKSLKYYVAVFSYNIKNA